MDEPSLTATFSTTSLQSRATNLCHWSDQLFAGSSLRQQTSHGNKSFHPTTLLRRTKVFVRNLFDHFATVAGNEPLPLLISPEPTPL